MFGDSWHILRKVLSHDIERAMDGYWSRIRREEQEGFLISPSAEVCCHALLCILPSALQCTAGTMSPPSCLIPLVPTG